MQIAGTDGTSVLNDLSPNDTLEIYDLALTGSVMPETCGDVATGTLLATFTLSSSWAGPAASGDNFMLLNGSPITSSIISTTGMPAYFRFTFTGVCTMQGNIGRAGTLDGSGKPWDILTDGQRWLAGHTASLNGLGFTALNSD